MIPKKPAPDLIRGAQRFSEKIMLKQAGQRSGSTTGGRAWRRVPAFRMAPACFLPAAAIHGSFERIGTDVSSSHDHQHHPASPRPACGTGADLPRVPRCGRDGQMASAQRLHRQVLQMDARVGGSHRMSFTNFGTGKSHSFGGSYVELTSHERIRYTDKFDDLNLPGEMQTTITLKKVSVGTEVSIVQEGVPAVIPAEACYLGWQESLTLLAKLVEAEIPD